MSITRPWDVVPHWYSQCRDAVPICVTARVYRLVRMYASIIVRVCCVQCGFHISSYSGDVTHSIQTGQKDGIYAGTY